MAYRHYLTTIISLMTFLSLCIEASASDLDIPNTFTDGEPAYADQINQNFQAIEAAVDDNQQQIDGKLSTAGGTISGNLTVTGNLTAASLNLSEPKLGSVTYSAKGFTPRESPSANYVKDRDGFLTLRESDDSEFFYHAVTLRSGVIMTRIRAHVQDRNLNDDQDFTVRLRKKELGKSVNDLAVYDTTDDEINLPNRNENIVSAELSPSELIAGPNSQVPPVSYYIEVFIEGRVRLFSVTIDYEYTEP